MGIQREIRTQHLDFSAEYTTVVDLSEESFSSGVATVTGIARPSVLLGLLVMVDEGTIAGADADTLVVSDTDDRTLATLDLDDTSPQAKGATGANALIVELGDLADDVARNLQVHANAARAKADLADGGTAGNIQTATAIEYAVDGLLYDLAATDDFWDLSGETGTAAGKWRAYALCVNTSGEASFIAGTDIDDTADAAADTASALATITHPARDAGVAVVGYVVCQPETDFSNALNGSESATYLHGRLIEAATYADPAAAEASTMSLKLTFSGGADNDPSAGTVRVVAFGIDIEA